MVKNYFLFFWRKMDQSRYMAYNIIMYWINAVERTINNFGSTLKKEKPPKIDYRFSYFFFFFNGVLEIILVVGCSITRAKGSFWGLIIIL